MALKQSPNVVTNGLIFYMDMNNRAKSWIGAPTTNLTAAVNTNDLNSGYAKAAGTTTTSNEILMPAQVLKYSGSKTLADTVYNASGWIAHTGTGGISSGQQITCSWYVKGISTSSVVWTWGGSHTGNASGYTVDLKTGTVSSVSMIGSETYSVENVGEGWWRLSCSTTMTGTSCYPQLNYSGVLAICGTQFELGNRASTYLVGTRAANQSVVDLMGRTTLTVNSLTYLSDSTFSFNGSNNNITSSSFTQHQVGAGTVMGWAYPTSTSGDLYFVAAGGTTTYGASRAIRINSGSWCSVNYGSSTEDWNGIVAANLNTWQQVAYAWNGTTIRFYLNGVEYTNTRSGLVTPLGSVLTIGATAWSPVYGYWPGKIGTIQMYNRALSAAEIQQNFNAQRSRYGI